MNNLWLKAGIVFGLSSAVVVSSWAFGGPCMPIVKACKEAGFVKGGHKTGKGLFENCVLPVVAGKKILPNASFAPAQLQQCGAIIKQKMETKKAGE